MRPARLLAAGLFAVLVSFAGTVSAKCTDGRIALRGDWGQAQFSIAVADTPRERSRGLMFVKEMPRSTGMLFVYPRPQRAAFWMKNTLIPLDMIFADARGVVQYVHHRAIPGDLRMIEGGTDILAVLEINGGLAQDLGIAPGTVLRHIIFAAGPAAWAC